MLVWWLCAVLGAAAAVGAAPDAARALAGAARFAVSSSVLLGDAAAPGAELGYRVQAALVLRARRLPEPGAGALLLHFTLESPKLMLRGKHRNAEFLPKPSIWDSVPSSEFLAMWSEGHITAAYLDPGDPPDIVDYKKALISLFQFQLEEGERNETDVSGLCHVHYEAVSDLVFRKSKMQCTWQGAVDEGDEDGCAERRRVARWELDGRGEGEGGGRLRALGADEVLLLRGADRAHALKARALHTLTRADTAPAPAPLADELADELARLPHLTAHALPLEPRDPPDDEDDDPQESLESALERHGAALSAELAGSAEAAEATLALLPALRAASERRLTELLERPDTRPEHLEGLARLLGLAGGRGAAGAARAALQLAARDPPGAGGREYLAALAHAPQVDEWVVRDTLRLATGGGALWAAALLAAAAASDRVEPPAARDRLQADIKNAITKGLAKCKEEACAAAQLQALGQLRRAPGDVRALLLERAETAAPPAALAAIAALEAGPRENYSGAARRRLERVALALGRAPRALPVRAAALQLALRAAADHPLALVPLTSALRSRGPRELRRVCWLRLRQLAATRPALAALLPRLDPRPRDWLRRAHDGTSSVLARAAGWARLDSAQLASAGVLRRGRVALAAHTERGDEHLLTVELWTNGMESFTSAPVLPRAAREAEDDVTSQEGEGEDVEGGLALTVGGVRRPDVTLFSGQGELLGHVWAGAGSAPTPVLRAVLPRAPRRHVFALGGGLVLRATHSAALALALDAQAAVSLWSRTARAGLALRGGGAERLELRARAAWGGVRAGARSAAQPALQLSAALDFYAAPQLCVHTHLPDHSYSRNVTLESSLGSPALRVRRWRVTSHPVPGRTLALGAPNDAACAALGSDHRD